MLAKILTAVQASYKGTHDHIDASFEETQNCTEASYKETQEQCSNERRRFIP
jgi:hypothetical protein